MTEPIRVRARKFLQEFFNDSELNTFCFDYFPQVFNDFTTGMEKNQKVLMLISYSERRDRISELLAALERERPKSYSNHFAEKLHLVEPKPQIRKTLERNPRQIFISYAYQDAVFAQRLAADFQASGWQTWIAPDSIHPGEKWVEAINRGLKECGVFVLVITPEAVDSRWVQTETNIAIELEHRSEMRLLPLDVRPADTPLTWNTYQWINFQQDYGIGLKTLFIELGSEKETISTTSRKFTSPIDQPRNQAETLLEAKQEYKDAARDLLKNRPTSIYASEKMPDNQVSSFEPSYSPSDRIDEDSGKKSPNRTGLAQIFIGIGFTSVLLFSIFLVAYLTGLFREERVTPTASATTQSNETSPTAVFTPNDSLIEEPTNSPNAFIPAVVSSGGCDYGGIIGSIEAIDRLTVRFTMCQSEPAFRAKAAFPAFSIQPAEWIASTGGAGDLLERPIGTGPYMLDKWVRSDSVLYTQFEDYWGTPANTERAVFRWSQQPAARLLELRAGTIDQMMFLNPSDVSTVQNDTDVEVISVPDPKILLELIPDFVALDNSEWGYAGAALARLTGVNESPIGSTRLANVRTGKDTIVYMQSGEPKSLYCADEIDNNSFRACQQVTETLLFFSSDFNEIVPGLATSCESNEDFTVWTCYLRDNVRFHDGSLLDANDVVESWAAGIDASSPFHVGNSGSFEYYVYFWNELMNKSE